MADTITNIWDSTLLEWVDSEEDYEDLRHSLEYDEAVGDYYRSKETRRVTGYIHERTGLVTADIRKFEEWLRKVEGR